MERHLVAFRIEEERQVPASPSAQRIIRLPLFLLIVQKLVRKMLFCLGLREFLRIVGRGVAFGNRQRHPIRSGQHLPQKDQLPHVIGVVRELPVDGFGHRMALVADVHRCGKIVGRQRIEGLKQASPAFLPFGQNRRPRLQVVLKLRLPVPRRLLAIGMQEIGPARQHVPPQVLHDGGHAVAVGMVLPKQLRVADLREALFAEHFVVRELFFCAFQIIVGHALVFCVVTSVPCGTLLLLNEDTLLRAKCCQRPMAGVVLTWMGRETHALQ